MDLSEHLVRKISRYQIFDIKVSLAFILCPRILLQLFHFGACLGFLQFYLVHDGRRLLLILLYDVDISLVIFCKFRVYDFLKLFQLRMSNEIIIVILMNEPVPFKLQHDFIGVIVVVVGGQVHILRVSHAWTLPGLVVRHQRYHLPA